MFHLLLLYTMTTEILYIVYFVSFCLPQLLLKQQMAHDMWLDVEEALTKLSLNKALELPWT